MGLRGTDHRRRPGVHDGQVERQGRSRTDGTVDDGPPRWQSYIAVESAVDTANNAEADGATIIMAPTDVGTAGRMAVLQDPSGAVVSIWEAGEPSWR